MKKFIKEKGVVIPLDRANVDTDYIIPKQFLKSIKRTGFGKNLFDEARYLDKGLPDEDCSHRSLNPDFVLNQPRYAGGSILLARRKFWLRFKPGACTLGARRLWYTLYYSAELCRYIL